MSTAYTVTVRTRCRACAMALAGHVPAIMRAYSVDVRAHDEHEAPGAVFIHANSARVQAHDGSPFACAEHGGESDLRREPRL